MLTWTYMAAIYIQQNNTFITV